MKLEEESLEKLEAILLSGVQSIKYGDKMVTYHDIASLIKLRKSKQDTSNVVRYSLASFE